MKWVRRGIFVGLILPKGSFYCTLVRRRLEHSGLGVFLDSLMAGFIVQGCIYCSFSLVLPHVSAWCPILCLCTDYSWTCITAGFMVGTGACCHSAVRVCVCDTGNLRRRMWVAEFSDFVISTDSWSNRWWDVCQSVMEEANMQTFLQISPSINVLYTASVCSD